MASAFGHAVAAIAVTQIASIRPSPKKLWVIAVLSAVMPDIDSIGFKFGVPYASMLGHRGLTHSILFAFLWAAFMIALFFRREASQFKYFLIIFLATVSHGVLDAMTNGGLGVGFLIPFKSERYFFNFRPIQVSPISISRFFQNSEKVLMNELLWIGLPCLILVLAAIPVQNWLRKHL